MFSPCLDTWKNGLTADVESLVDCIMSNRTVFHLQSSQVLMNMSGCQGLSDNSTYTDLASSIEEVEEQRVTRSKSKPKVINAGEILRVFVGFSGTLTQ